MMGDTLDLEVSKSIETVHYTYSQSSESSVHVYRSHLIQLFDVVRVVWFLNLADDYRLRWPFQLEYAMRFARPTTASSTRSLRDDSLKIRVYSVSAVIACLCIVYWPVWGAIYARNCLYRIVWVYPTWCPIAWRLLRAPLAAALHAYVRRLLHKYIHVPGNKKRKMGIGSSNEERERERKNKRLPPSLTRKFKKKKKMKNREVEEEVGGERVEYLLDIYRAGCCCCFYSQGGWSFFFFPSFSFPYFIFFIIIFCALSLTLYIAALLRLRCSPLLGRAGKKKGKKELKKGQRELREREGS